MQYAYPHGYTYPHFRGQEEPRYLYRHRHRHHPPPPPTNYYTPPNHGGYPVAYGQSYNAGGNFYDGHGIQRNGNVNISNGNANNKKRKNRKTNDIADTIGGCHNNQGGHQVSGDVILGDFY